MERLGKAIWQERGQLVSQSCEKGMMLLWNGDWFIVMGI